MVEKRTVLDALEFGADGTVSVRLRKQIVLDGETLKDEFHRTVIPAGMDPEKQMTAVSEHLKQMGFPAVAPADIARIAAVAGRTA